MTRHTPSDLRFRHNPLTAVNRGTSWHQWQAAYPTLSSTGTSRSPGVGERLGAHSHQSTGLRVLEEVRARVRQPVCHEPTLAQVRRMCDQATGCTGHAEVGTMFDG